MGFSVTYLLAQGGIDTAPSAFPIHFQPSRAEFRNPWLCSSCTQAERKTIVLTSNKGIDNTVQSERVTFQLHHTLKRVFKLQVNSVPIALQLHVLLPF